MELTPEQVNILISGSLIIVSAIVGGVITIIAGLITNSFQKNQQKTKSREEIFNGNFAKVESFALEIMNKCRKLSFGLIHDPSIEQVGNQLWEIFGLKNNILTLAGLRVTNDERILKAYKGFSTVLDGFVQNINLYISSQDKEEAKKVVLQSLGSLEESYFHLKEGMDAFRLNDYKPLHIADINFDNIKKW